MNITAQVSVYPLGKPALDPPIQHAIARLQAAGLIAESGSVSTVVAGEAVAVFDTLREVSSRVGWSGTGDHVGHVFKCLFAVRPTEVIRPHEAAFDGIREERGFLPTVKEARKPSFHHIVWVCGCS